MVFLEARGVGCECCFRQPISGLQNKFVPGMPSWKNTIRFDSIRKMRMKHNDYWNRRRFRTTFLTLLIAVFAASAHAKDFELPSTFNPVGSGARAVGMGGAFIAVADDATAASWNPGGLVQLKKPELSAVVSATHRKEKARFADHPEGNGDYDVLEGDLNYFSAAYPFEMFRRNMIVSLSYQRLFDFDRDWKHQLADEREMLSYVDQWDFTQEGELTALGFSFCAGIVPRRLSVGLTLNIWDDGLTSNRWRQTYRINREGLLGTTPFFSDYFGAKEYSFEGVNANIGVLWSPTDKITFGAVLKTPFTADVHYRLDERRVASYPSEPGANQDYSVSYSRDDELEMPMSYGIGVLYRFSPRFYVTADVFATEWDEFVYKIENGEEVSPVTGFPMDETETRATFQVRAGAEYLIVDEFDGWVVPLRCGVFYDPAPAEKSPDDYYGFSLGTGFTRNGRFSIDVAWQYRFGSNVGATLFPGTDFHQDVEEHKFYFSMIYYWSGSFWKGVSGR